LSYLRFASIDIGSNAVRLLCSYVIETDQGPIFKKGLLARVPIRLGMETFSNGTISDSTMRNLSDCILGFKKLIQAQEITYYRAYATSAMREAANQEQVLKYIEKNTGVRMEVISGQHEAKLISGRQLPEEVLKMPRSLFVDVGGGSTELSLKTQNGHDRESFKIGTLRLLSDGIKEPEWLRLEDWLKDRDLGNTSVPIIGSGGNITRVFKLKKKEYSDAFISTRVIRDFYNELNKLPSKEIMLKYHFNPDRADVIVPAMRIYFRIIDITRTEQIFVPKSGLSDGMVRMMYDEFKAGN
jgi:exopolyphosphatase / guanosine-5'-triphosphate,3'-diphosphate pyrophosphatase